MSRPVISTQMIDHTPFHAPFTTPQAGFTIADYFMQNTTVEIRDLLGQPDKEWVSKQLGSLHPFPPDY